jgi:hypothetical protein
MTLDHTCEYGKRCMWPGGLQVGESAAHNLASCVRVEALSGSDARLAGKLALHQDDEATRGYALRRSDCARVQHLC